MELKKKATLPRTTVDDRPYQTDMMKMKDVHI